MDELMRGLVVGEQHITAQELGSNVRMAEHTEASPSSHLHVQYTDGPHWCIMGGFSPHLYLSVDGRCCDTLQKRNARC